MNIRPFPLCVPPLCCPRESHFLSDKHGVFSVSLRQTGTKHILLFTQGSLNLESPGKVCHPTVSARTLAMVAECRVDPRADTCAAGFSVFLRVAEISSSLEEVLIEQLMSAKHCIKQRNQRGPRVSLRPLGALVSAVPFRLVNRPSKKITL